MLVETAISADQARAAAKIKDLEGMLVYTDGNDVYLDSMLGTVTYVWDRENKRWMASRIPE